MIWFTSVDKGPGQSGARFPGSGAFLGFQALFFEQNEAC